MSTLVFRELPSVQMATCPRRGKLALETTDPDTEPQFAAALADAGAEAPTATVTPTATETTNRAAANEVFKAGDYARARELYTALLKASDDAVERAVLLGNRAACALHLGDKLASAEDCRDSLALSPLSAKVYERLARSIVPSDPAAVAAVAAAVALALPQQLSRELEDLYAKIEALTARSTSGLRLPRDSRLIVRAASSSDINRVAPGGIVVLTPGTYDLSSPVLSPRYSLFGLGAVTLRSASSHAFYVAPGISDVQLVNLRLMGSGGGAAVCIGNPYGRLCAVGCRVEDYAEAGLLVVGGSAELTDCTFRRCTGQAVEVREGGMLVATRVKVEECKQGFVLYGGARGAQLADCVVLRCALEGILVDGSRVNAATQMQFEAAKKSMFGSFNQASESAAAWGRVHQLGLEVTMSGSTVAHCGNFGISVDHGARLVIARSRLEYNDPYNVLVKGDSDLSMVASQCIFGTGRSRKSAFAQHTNKVLDFTGVKVDFNYSGDVQLHGNAFVGPSERAIQEASKQLDQHTTQAARRLGMWSKPAVLSNNGLFATLGDMPSTEQLVVASSSYQSSASGQSRASKSDFRDLCRVSRTFQQSTWDVTTCEHYPIGNTFGFDVTGGVVPDGPSAILLVGCGDVRNLLATVSASAAAAPPAKLSFVLNDGDVGQLARDAVMLFIAAGGAPAEAVLAIWANHALSASHADLVQQSCVALASQPWPAWLRASSSLGAPSDCAENVAEAAIRAACRAWAASSLSLSHLLSSRAANLSGSSSEISCAIDLSLAAVRLGAGGSTDTHIEKAVRDYVRSGSLASEGVELTCPNVTLLSAPELQYLVYFSSSIVRAVPLAAAESGCRRDAASLHHRLLGTVAPQVTAFVDGVSDGRVAVTLVPGDILVVAAVEPTAVFDFIDTSNVADYISIPSLVQMCAPLLSLLPHSRLFVESIVFHGKWADSLPKDSCPQAFARFSLGLPLDDHGRMLGLCFLGGSELRRPGTAGVRLVWQPAPRSPVSALSLVLDLLPIAKAWVGKHTEPIHALSTCEWAARASPLVLVHLVALQAQFATRIIIDALLRATDSRTAKESLSLFKWELTLHASIQTRRAPPLVKVALEGQGSVRLAAHLSAPLLLAFSTAPLAAGAAVALKDVKQLASAFSWDGRAGSATFLVSEKIAGSCGAWFLTLCVLSRAGLQAVGTSCPLSSLPATPVTDLCPWPALSTLPHALQAEIDCTLVTALAFSPTNGGSGCATWRSVVTRGLDEIFVDLLSPDPLPKESELDVIVSDHTLRVFVDNVLAFELVLPGAMDGAPHRTKLLRRLGAICMRFGTSEQQEALG